MREQDHESAQARALSFIFKVPADLIETVGLPKAPTKKQGRAEASMLAALTIAADCDNRWLSYSRSKDYYAAACRYEGTDYTYASVLGAVKTLGSMGLIEERRSKPGAHLSHGLQSRLRPSDRLVDLIGNAPVAYLGRRSPIIMKNEDGKLVDFQDSAETERLIADAGEVNAYLAGVKVEISPDASDSDWRYTRHHLHARKVRDGRETWTCVRPTPVPEVYRVYGRGCWDIGGRWYGWWQNLPKDRRAELLINGELSIEPDFAALHPCLLYALRGHVLQHDPYALRGYERSVGKAVLNTCINAKTIPIAIGSLMEKRKALRADGSPEWIYGYDETKRIVGNVMDANSAIRQDIGSDAGVRLMHIDAEMTHRVLKACAKSGIGALPVHDAVRVPGSREREVTAIMSEVLSSTVSELSKRPSDEVSIKNVRYMGGRGRVEVSVGTVVTPKAEPVVSSLTEPGALSGAVGVAPAPEVGVRHRAFLRVAPPRPVASSRTRVVHVPEPVVLSLPVEPAAPPVVAPVPVASPSTGPGLPAFLRACLEPVAPETSPEPMALSPPPRPLSGLAALRRALAPAEVVPDIAGHVPVAPAPRPVSLAVMTLASALPSQESVASTPAPVSVPRPSAPLTKQERIDRLRGIAASLRADMAPEQRRLHDDHMRVLKETTARERRPAIVR